MSPPDDNAGWLVAGGKPANQTANKENLRGISEHGQSRWPGQEDCAHSKPAPGVTLAAALTYLDQGWRIFPVDQEKKPANARGALGPYVESVSEAERWWKNGTKFGIACATGQGLLVIDVDLPLGPAALVRLEERLGPLPHTRTIRTPTGGGQLLFRVPSDFCPRNTQGELAEGIDTRCKSGYIVLPPSHGHYHKDLGNGRTLIDGDWEWASSDDFAELPLAWRERIAEVSATRTERASHKEDRPPQPPLGKRHDRIGDLLDAAREAGNWHASVLTLSAHLVAKGRSDREILAHASELTCEGFTIEETRAELIEFIRGAREKGFAPPEPASGESAANLLAMTFPPIRYTVERYVVEGLTLLGGRPKVGKSWLALDFAVAVATGGFALGSIRCEQGDVLYLALEDNRRRLQTRLQSVIGDSPPAGLDRLTFRTEAERLDGGLIDALEAWRGRVPDARLVIIDVLAKVRPQRKGGEGVYEHDYRSVESLQQWAIKHGVAVLVVHHVRKAEAEDPLEMLSGSNGLTGAADTVLVLARTSQGLTLYGRGRDIEEVETAVSRDDGAWHILGDAEEVRKSDERRAILHVLRESGEPMGPAEIASATGMKDGNVRFLLNKLVKAGDVRREGYGRYSIPPANTANTANASDDYHYV
ncbi:MAG: AAA family ATPase [Rhodospirillales bacterium]|nr:AAA family ATPase [Rhodospirillales bacterium]